MTGPVTKPIVHKFLGGYMFQWCEGAEQVLTLTARRVHESHGAISAEISVDHFYSDPLLGSQNTPLIALRVNLSSKRGRDEIVKRLTDLQVFRQLEASYANPIVDWNALVEQVSGEIIQREREGDPVLLVSSIDEVQEFEYLVDPIAPLKKPTVLFGDPDSGKSQFLSVLGILVALPWTNNPLRLVAPSSPHRVLFLDYEADVEDIRRQLKKLVIGMDLEFVALYYRRCSLPLADDLESIANHAINVGADTLFIDSISLACGGDLNSTQLAGDYFRALRHLNMTTISIAHTNKDRESKSKTILGSVLFEAGARSVWEVRGQQGDDSLDIALFHKKANLSRKSKPLGYRISYNSDSTTIEWCDPRSVPEFVERMGTRERVISFLKESPATKEKIIETLGITKDNCGVTLSRLKKDGIAIKQEYTERWGLIRKDD